MRGDQGEDDFRRHPLAFENIGVVSLPANEAQSPKVFEFAKKWQIPSWWPSQIPTRWMWWKSLCKEYNIKGPPSTNIKSPISTGTPAFVLAANQRPRAAPGPRALMSGIGPVPVWDPSSA